MNLYLLLPHTSSWHGDLLTTHRLNFFIHSFIHQWLYSPLLGPVLYFSFVIFFYRGHCTYISLGSEYSHLSLVSSHFSNGEPEWRSLYSYWLRAGQPIDQSSSPSRVKNFFFSTSSTPALGSTQAPLQWVPGASLPGSKAAGA
jgi:hypothetical protein